MTIKKTMILSIVLIVGLCVAATIAFAQGDAGSVEDAVSATVNAAPAADAQVADDLSPEVADAAEAPEVDPVGTVTEIVRDMRSGDWRHAIAGLLTLLMFGWNWARKNVSWLKEKIAGDRAGAISVVAIAVGGSLIMTLSGEDPLSYKTLLAGLWTAVESAGIFTLLTRIISPPDKKKTA